LKDEITLFEIDRKETFPSERSFREYLAQSSVLHWVLEHYDLYIAVAVMDIYDAGSLERILNKNNFAISERFGTIWRVRRISTLANQAEENFEFYLAPDWENGIACFYTNFRKTEEIKRFLMPMIGKTPNIDSFVIYPSLIQRVLDQVFEEFPLGRIKEFTAKTTPGTAALSVKRPDIKRTMMYWGDDGIDTYPEMHDSYGTAIVRAVVELPESQTKFKLSHEGVIALCNGDPAVFFELLDRFVLPEAKRQHAIVTHATTRYVSVGTGSRAYQVPIVFPMKIRLRTPLRYYRAESMLQNTFDESKFPALSYFLREGSLFLDAVLVDANWQNHFRVKANEDWIKLLPGKYTRLSTLLRFYQMVIDNLDPYATLEVEG